MAQQTLVYSEERNTWNLFVDNEWYFEGTYEQCSDMMFENAAADNADYDTEDYSDDYYEDDFGTED